MSHKVGSLAKALPTITTLVRFLPRVQSLVYEEVCSPPKTFFTVRTFVRLLSGVNSLVSVKVCPLVETFPAFRTLMRLIFCVDALMSEEVPSPGKDLPTLEAFACVFSKRNPFESVVVWPLTESLPIRRVPVWFVVRVHALMFDKV